MPINNLIMLPFREYEIYDLHHPRTRQSALNMRFAIQAVVVSSFWVAVLDKLTQDFEQITNYSEYMYVSGVSTAGISKESDSLQLPSYFFAHLCLLDVRKHISYSGRLKISTDSKAQPPPIRLCLQKIIRLRIHDAKGQFLVNHLSYNNPCRLSVHIRAP